MLVNFHMHRLFVIFYSQWLLNHFAFNSFAFARTGWRLFKNFAVCIKFDIYVFIKFITDVIQIHPNNSVFSLVKRPRHILWSYLCSMSSVKMRDDFSYCWYWWNWWPSLFKLFFSSQECTILLQNCIHYHLQNQITYIMSKNCTYQSLHFSVQTRCYCDGYLTPQTFQAYANT